MPLQGFWSVTPVVTPRGQKCAWCQQREQHTYAPAAPFGAASVQQPTTVAPDATTACTCCRRHVGVRGAPQPQHCLVWLCQDIEPDVPRSLPLIKSILRRVLHSELSGFIEVRRCQYL